MSRHVDEWLALFPGLNSVGGVQTSGRIAREALSRNLSRLSLFYFDPSSSDGPGDEPGTFSNSRLDAARKAASIKKTPKCILIWHISLAKLLPFLRSKDDRVYVFLHGIEAWKKHDWLTRRHLNKAHFLSNSNFTWERFVALNPGFGARPHTVVPLGIGTCLDVPPPSPVEIPIAVMISRIDSSEDYKGHREVLHAWHEVVRRLPRAELRIIGDGTLRADLEQLVVQLRMTESIRLLGSVSESTKHEMIQQCRCLLMPSRNEGFGLVYVEAMRLGRPCLVSTMDAGREVVNPPEAGLAVDPGDLSSLTESIRRLLTLDEEWNSWSEAARNRYESFFTEELFQRRLLRALQVESL